MADLEPQAMTSTSLDLYCERCSAEFWAEPINALSNGSFLLAALAAWWLARKAGKLDWQMWVLIAIAVSIAIGSFLFHTFATHSTKWLDLLPIFLFQLWFLWLYARRFLHWRQDAAAALVGGFFAIMMAAQQIPHYYLNGSLTYAPAFLTLLGLGVYHYQHQAQERWTLLAAALVFTIALTFRSIDMLVCEKFPWGTHFLWHLFNGGLIYLTMRALILGQSKSPVVAAAA